MTIDYTIAVLQALWRYNICGYPEDEIREALDMAVEALKQERRRGTMTEEQIRQIENYNEQKRVRDLKEWGSHHLQELIFILLERGAGVHWLSDVVNDTIEIYLDHQEGEEE